MGWGWSEEMQFLIVGFFFEGVYKEGVKNQFVILVYICWVYVLEKEMLGFCGCWYNYVYDSFIYSGLNQEVV